LLSRSTPDSCALVCQSSDSVRLPPSSPVSRILTVLPCGSRPNTTACSCREPHLAHAGHKRGKPDHESPQGTGTSAPGLREGQLHLSHLAAIVTLQSRNVEPEQIRPMPCGQKMKVRQTPPERTIEESRHVHTSPICPCTQIPEEPENQSTRRVGPIPGIHQRVVCRTRPLSHRNRAVINNSQHCCMSLYSSCDNPGKA